MGARFCFFTDPTLLNAQASSEAFGPITPTTGTKDEFRVTDLHTASAGAPVFAICDGLVCAQKDAQGTLTLILKPSHQPPFDFPAISYFLYKGVDPLSLLTSDGEYIDTSKVAGNDLIKTIKTAWELPGNANTGDPTRACLGLDLNPIDYPVVADRLKYEDGDPLDRLFYEGDPDMQLPLVHRGWRLGSFGSSFGMEIIVERIGYTPQMALARKVETTLSVNSLDPQTTYARDDDEYFTHWHSKEDVLSFVDPCAFWGSHHAHSLKVWSAGAQKFSKISGNGIYETVLRGAAAGTSSGPNLFHNCNKVYLDVRNEHDHSYNYYQNSTGNVFATFDPTAAMDGHSLPYYGSKWPSLAIDHTLLPSTFSGSIASLRLALALGGNTTVVVYLPDRLDGTGRRRPAKVENAFVSDGLRSPEYEVAVPVHNGPPLRTISCYRRVAVSLSDPPEDDAASPSEPAWTPPTGVPIDTFEIPFRRSGATGVKTYSGTYLIAVPYLTQTPAAYSITAITNDGTVSILLSPLPPYEEDVTLPALSHSHVYDTNAVVDALNRLVTPVPIFPRDASGTTYLDVGAPDSFAAGIPRAAGRRCLLVFDRAAFDAIILSRTSAVLALLITMEYASSPNQPVRSALLGLRSDAGKVHKFIDWSLIDMSSNAHS